MKKTTFLLIGIGCFLWWLIDFFYKLRLYQEYHFLWFCSISLLLIAIGFIFRKPAILISVLSIALIFQVDWILDFFSHAFFLTPLTTSTSYIFEYGHTLPEFILSLRHLFMIPLAFLGIKEIKKTGKYAIIVTISILILLGVVSFFITTPVYNINCSQRPCWTTQTNISKWVWGPFFLSSLIILSGLLVSPLLNVFFKKSFKEKKYEKVLNFLIIFFFMLAILGIIFGSLAYSKIPHYICENNDKKIFCENAEFNSNRTQLYISYNIKADEMENCTIVLYSEKEVLGKQEILIEKGKIKLYFPVPPPEKNTKVHLEADCQKF